MTKRLTLAVLAAGLAMGTALPALADCATSGLRVKCIYAGPDGADDTRSDISARFVTVTTGQASALQDRSAPAATRQVSVGRHVVPPVRAARHVLQPGDTLPAEVLILMNPIRYGLPRPRDGWTYFTVDDDIYRADIHTRRVLNYINPHINRY